MGVNRELVEGRLGLIASYLGHLEKLSKVSREHFVADAVTSAAAESYLRRSLEVVFDIGRHLVAKGGLAHLSAEYKSIARGLVKLGVVTPGLGETLAKMAGYRNRLVHLYSAVTEEELHVIVGTCLEDLWAFVRAVRDYHPA